MYCGIIKADCTDKSAPNVCMTNPRTIADYYMEHLRHENKEHLIVCMFDNKCHMKGDKLLSVGSANETIVSPREVFKQQSTVMQHILS